MKEDITRYKGTNPLIGIPASLGIFAYCVSILTLILAFWPDDARGWSGFFWGLAMIGPFGIAISPIVGIIDYVTEAPCIIYASKKGVRAIVAIACLIGITILLVMLTSLEKPSFSSIVSSACYAFAMVGVILLVAQFVIVISVDIPAKAKPARINQPQSMIFSLLAGAMSCLCLGLYQHKRELLSLDRGESLFFVFTVSAISLLWFEDKKTGMADREIIPLCTTSILWMVSALVANYAYASLASVTFVLPYLVYFLPLILLGFYYYVTAPDES